MNLHSSEKSTNVRWLIIAMLMAFSLMSYFNRLSISVAADEIRSAYHFSETQVGTVISAMLLAYTLCMIPGGRLSDRIGGWRALVIMGLGTAACTAATGLLAQVVPTSRPAWMLVSLFLVRGAMGAFTAPLYPACGRVAAKWIPFSQRALANAMVTGVAMVGIALTYPLFGTLLHHVGLTNAFLISAAITATIVAFWWSLGRDEPQMHPKVNQAELNCIMGDQEIQTDTSRHATAGHEQLPPVNGIWKRILRNRSLWLLTASYSTIGYVEYLVFYWSENYFKNVLEFSEVGGNVAAMIPPFCMGLCMPLGGWLSDRMVHRVGYRLGRALVAGTGMVGCATMLICATIVSEPIAIVSCFALALAFIGITEAPAWATAIELGGRSSATSASIANTGGNLGGALSPTISPWVSAILVENYGMAKDQSWGWAMRLAGVICILGAVLWVRIDAAERTT